MHISTRNKLKYFGLKRFCPVCRSWLRYFRPHGNKPRLDALCPVCHSLERHRLVWLFFKDKTNLFEAPLKMLHAAPENCFIRRLRNRENIDYTSIDIESNLADKNMDLTCLDFENETFDVFYCSHVLEHIPDDKKALAEIHRVLKKTAGPFLWSPCQAKPHKKIPTSPTPQNGRNVSETSTTTVFTEPILSKNSNSTVSRPKPPTTTPNSANSKPPSGAS